MSNELQDWEIWLLAAIVLSQSGYIVRLRRKVRTLESGHLKAVAVHADPEEPPESDRRLRRVKVWFGLAAIAGVARWIGRAGHPATTAVALVGVAVAGAAIVLLPQMTEMAPQAVSPPATSIRQPTTRGPTAPPAVSGTPTPTETASTPPPSTTVAPTTVPPPTTDRRTSPPPSPTTDAVPTPTVATSATVSAGSGTTVPAGVDTPATLPAPLAVQPVSDSTPAPRRHLLCVRPLIELGDCGTA